MNTSFLMYDVSRSVSYESRLASHPTPLLHFVMWTCIVRYGTDIENELRRILKMGADVNLEAPFPLLSAEKRSIT